MAATEKPLLQRPVDLVFAIVFACFTVNCLAFDSLNALGIPLAGDSPNPLARATFNLYAKDADLLLIANPWLVQIECFISVFLFAPFYLVAIYALWKQRAWIHLPAIV